MQWREDRRFLLPRVQQAQQVVREGPEELEEQEAAHRQLVRRPQTSHLEGEAGEGEVGEAEHPLLRQQEQLLVVQVEGLSIRQKCQYPFSSHCFHLHDRHCTHEELEEPLVPAQALLQQQQVERAEQVGLAVAMEPRAHSRQPERLRVAIRHTSLGTILPVHRE